MPDYTIVITVKDVADGDITDLAQSIWDQNADAFDADRGDFSVAISKGGFPMDWEPYAAA